MYAVVGEGQVVYSAQHADSWFLSVKKNQTREGIS